MPQEVAQVNKYLTGVSNRITPQGYISEVILPLINVKQTTGTLADYGNSHLRIDTTLTVGKNKYPEVDTRTYATQTYAIEKHGLTDVVTEEDKANVELPFNAEQDTCQELMDKIWLEKEKGLADAITNTANLTQNVTLSGTDQLSDYANSDPLLRFSNARSVIYNAVGKAPNAAIMSWDVWNKIRYHPDLLDNLGFKHNRAGGLKQQELANSMDVERLIIGEAVYNSAKQGQPDVIAPVWGKHIVFAVLPKAAAKRQISLGYRLQQFGKPRRVFKGKVAENNPPNATRIVVDDSYDQIISKAAAGYLIENAIA